MTPANRTQWAEPAGDFVIASVLLILTLPLMAVIALSIKLDSRGPILYREERIDPNGCRYNARKFRTVAHDNRSIGGARREEHFTRVGWYLWYTRLEKLPQLINVLSGEMSCIRDSLQRPYFFS